jgi:hypothetical protein
MRVPTAIFWFVLSGFRHFSRGDGTFLLLVLQPLDVQTSLARPRCVGDVA